LVKALFPHDVKGTVLDNLPSDMLPIISFYLMSLRAQHVSVVACGHLNSGKTTLANRLVCELGGLTPAQQRELQETPDASPATFTSVKPNQSWRPRWNAATLTIQASYREFFTPSKHFTIIDGPGERNFIKNMIKGASQADVAILMVPSNKLHPHAIARGNRYMGERQGNTRHHALLVNLLGIRQLIVCINNMDEEAPWCTADQAPFSCARYQESANEIRHLLIRIGWIKKFIEESVPIIPISALHGDNVILKSSNMQWWHGTDLQIKNKMVRVETILDCLENMVFTPTRDYKSPLKVPISQQFRTRGVLDIFIGRVDQGILLPGAKVVFLNANHTLCTGVIKSIELHRKSVGSGIPGDICAFKVTGIPREIRPRVGDVMVLQGYEQTLRPAASFTAMVRMLDLPGEAKPGYTMFAFCRTGRAPCRIVKINWKMSRATGNVKEANPKWLRASDMAKVVFRPEKPFIVDTFRNSDLFGRVAMLEGLDIMALCKVTAVEFVDLDNSKPKR